MNAPPASHVDLRAFRWRLTALEGMRSAALDSARRAVASRQRGALEAEQTLDAIDVRVQGGIAAASVAPEGALDAARHARSIAYLLHLAEDLARSRLRVDEARQQLLAAQAACARSHMELALLRKLRERAQKVYATTAQRIQQAEADAAWLARRPRQHAGSEGARR